MVIFDEKDHSSQIGGDYQGVKMSLQSLPCLGAKRPEIGSPRPSLVPGRGIYIMQLASQLSSSTQASERCPASKYWMMMTII